MTPRLSRLVDAVLPRVGLALAVYRIGLLTVERDAARKALEIERAAAIRWKADWMARCFREYDGRIEAEARLVRWRDALGKAMATIPHEAQVAPILRTLAAVRAILDE